MSLSKKAQETLAVLNGAVSANPANNDTADRMHGFDVHSLPSSDLALRRTKAVAAPSLPALEYARSNKRASKLSRRLPSGKNDHERHLCRMSNHSDQLAYAMTTKVQAPKAVAEQIAALAAHDTKLLKQAERARVMGKVSRVQSLTIQIEANRKRALELIERFVDADHAFAAKPLVPTIAFGDDIRAGTIARPTADKRTVSKAAPLKQYTYKHVDGIGKNGATTRKLVKADKGRSVLAK